MHQETSAQIRLAISRQCASLGIPVSGIFELTPRCNLRCKMCYVRLTPEEMRPIGNELSTGQWISIAQQAKEAGTLFLLLTGGEPTLRKDFCQLYEQIAQMGFSISVNTNGTLLSPAIRELWKKYPPAMVNITLYGTCKEDYQRLCGDGAAFDRVSDALNWLISQGILVHLNTTIAPDNADRWLQLEEFAASLGLDLRMTTYCFPPARRMGSGSCNEFSRISAEDAADLICRDMIYQHGLPFVQKVAATLSAPPQMECEGIGETIQCMAGRAQYWMTWDGRMTPCGMLPEPVAYPVQNGFLPAWKELTAQTAQIRLCPDCVNCADKDTCMNCAAVMFTETGKFDGKPEYMCTLNRTYRKLIRKLAENDAARG